MDEFNSALYFANLIYGIELEDIDPLIEIGLIAWNKIGKSNSRLYKMTVDTSCDSTEIELPCNCDYIESVNSAYEDWNKVSNIHPNGDFNSLFVETYSKILKTETDPIYQPGKLVHYQRIGNKLILNDVSGPVTIVYKGTELGDDGLPLINDKQKEAIACYIAYITKFKEGMATHNLMVIQESLLLNQQWLRLCDAARVAEYLSQNDMNKILDVKTTFNRKTYGKSFKPIQ